MSEHPEIPKGPYCHSLEGGKSGYVCPYWTTFKDMEEQNNGRCLLRNTSKDDTHGAFMERLYLWDQMKVCGYNLKEDENDEN